MRTLVCLLLVAVPFVGVVGSVAAADCPPPVPVEVRVVNAPPELRYDKKKFDRTEARGQLNQFSFDFDETDLARNEGKRAIKYFELYEESHDFLQDMAHDKDSKLKFREAAIWLLCHVFRDNSEGLLKDMGKELFQLAPQYTPRVRVYFGLPKHEE